MTSDAPKPITLDTLSRADFEACRGESFRLATPSGEIPLRLAEVTEIGRTNREGGAFSLIFVAPRGPFLPQAVYSITRANLGPLDIFIVPIGPLGDGNGYEAIFS